MSTWLGTEPMSLGRVTLRPLVSDDADALARVVGDPGRFRWAGVPSDLESSRRWLDTARADPSYRVAYAVIDNTDGRLVGSTSYYEIDPTNLAATIGYTFYAEDVQGSSINPTAKFLLMRHAFEHCAAVRLVWHTHEHNARSRAAIATLGATFEGLLRKHRRFGDGWRTTAQYAMTDDDWPAAKTRLLERISE
ncbi:GNAT family N-acetyltransferase [Gordonia sp. HNM0687]|uniref:GNAT family N-acetyltransferase n=1 Tax=Gordonia mangrovi TaxID=2665643 RepID=A0A6L7GP44_9ACTN|nr:GNAT family protein [Gordonia mangrovi]MXP21679.1 GNAT family N-acetyltransferase [Gordonia mangrovi]UVF80413.1 GNAT family N-acetyltransferase [Gordonia mangrovi]